MKRGLKNPNLPIGPNNPIVDYVEADIRKNPPASDIPITQGTALAINTQLLNACKAAYEIISIESDEENLSHMGKVFAELTQKLEAAIGQADPGYVEYLRSVRKGNCCMDDEGGIQR